MLLTFLSEKPTVKTTKYLLILGSLLLISGFPIVIGLLELSNFPGTLNETQLGFNGEYIRSMFSLMSNEEMMIFIIANLFDYVAMIAYGTFIFSSALILTRKLQEGSIWNQLGYLIAITGIIAACCDGIENIFLLMMASNPVNFPNYLAILHSCFALFKFILLYISMGWIILTVILIVSFRLVNYSALKRRSFVRS
ncbi:MAG: hypothetical protein ACFFC7_26160 [Candidatus Hermodarchaeota archaeon]